MQEQIKTDKIISELLEIIRKNKGEVSPKELAVQTGNSLDKINSGLNRLLELYEARVKLNQETGDLQFLFKYPFFERGKKTFSEKIAYVFNKFYKIFKIVYKASIGVVLICYTIIFAIIILVATTASAQNSNSDNRRDSGDGFNLIAVMLRAILEAMNFMAYKRVVEYAVDPYGNRYKTYKKEKNKGASFIQSVFTFVFGPEQPAFDPLADAKEALAYIRLFTRGKFTSANIIELTGKNYQDAESRLAEYIGKFNGELQITNSGVLYGDFTHMLGKIATNESQYIEYYKDEVEPPVELTGNSSGRNFAIILMNSFNLFMSTMFFSGGIAAEFKGVSITQFAFLGAFPLVVSLLYFIIPVLRLPAYFKRKTSRKYKILHKKLIGYICSSNKSNFTLQEFINFSNVSNNTDFEFIKTILNKIVLELEGEINISNDGKIVYNFERLHDELVVSRAS